MTVLDPLGDSLDEMLTAPPPLFKARDHHSVGGERRGNPAGARGRGTPGSDQRDPDSRKISLARRSLAAAASPPAAPGNPLISASDVVTSPEVNIDEALKVVASPTVLVSDAVDQQLGPDCSDVPDGTPDVTEQAQ